MTNYLKNKYFVKSLWIPKQLHKNLEQEARAQKIGLSTLIINILNLHNNAIGAKNERL